MKKYIYFFALLLSVGCGQPVKIIPISKGYVVVSCPNCSFTFTFFGKETIADATVKNRQTERSTQAKVNQYKGFSTLTISNSGIGTVTGQIYVDGRLAASESKYFSTNQAGVLVMNYNPYK